MPQQHEAVAGQSGIADLLPQVTVVAQQRSLDNHAFVGIERQRPAQFFPKAPERVDGSKLPGTRPVSCHAPTMTRGGANRLPSRRPGRTVWRNAPDDALQASPTEAEPRFVKTVGPKHLTTLRRVPAADRGCSGTGIVLPESSQPTPSWDGPLVLHHGPYEFYPRSQRQWPFEGDRGATALSGCERVSAQATPGGQGASGDASHGSFQTNLRGSRATATGRPPPSSHGGVDVRQDHRPELQR